MSENGDAPDAFNEMRWREMWEAFTARRAVAARPLTGGISAETVLIDYISPAGMLCQAVARRHGPIDFARNPRIAWDELALLEVLRDAGVPAPDGIGVSDAGFFPTPVLFIEFIEGTSEPPATQEPERAAELLAQIHRCPTGDRLAFLPRRTAAIPPAGDQLDTSLSEPRIRAALASVDLPATREDVLLHGDFWPGNLIWDHLGNPHAIDWEDAAIGDPLSDLANARLEWRLAANARVSERFTRRYVEITGRGIESLPWWDLWAALKLCGRLGGFGLVAVTERRWRAKHRRFVDEAIANLTGS